MCGYQRDRDECGGDRITPITERLVRDLRRSLKRDQKHRNASGAGSIPARFSLPKSRRRGHG